MKRILVISDTHKELKYARIAILHEMKKSLDMVIHCGDHIDDAERLERLFPEITFHYVPGNCDGYFFRENETTKLVGIYDKKILFTHGHDHNVKFNYDKLFEDAKNKGAHLALYGHTHFAHIQTQKRTGITVLNPGSISLPRDSSYPSYTVLNLEKDQKIGIEMMIIKDENPIKSPFF